MSDLELSGFRQKVRGVHLRRTLRCILFVREVSPAARATRRKTMPNVAPPPSQIFEVNPTTTTPISEAAASYIFHRHCHVGPQPYRGGYVHPVPRPATAPSPQPQVRPSKIPTPKAGVVLARTAPRRPYHGLRSDNVREILQGRKAHPADPKSIDYRPMLPSASRRLARTTPHLPVQAFPLDADGVATLHRQLQRKEQRFGLGVSDILPYRYVPPT